MRVAWLDDRDIAGADAMPFQAGCDRDARRATTNDQNLVM
jgi:hypothetical protein